MEAVVVNLPATSGVIINTGGCLVLHSTRETSGSAAAIYRLWDSPSASGQLLLTVSLTISESTRDYFAPHILPFKTGLYFELVSGALEGDVSVLCDHRCHDAWVWALHHAMSESDG